MSIIDKLYELQVAIRRHRDLEFITGRARTIMDDKNLYSVLPENGRVRTDFRLTPESEFLGQFKQGAGCQNFWSSHATCGKLCNINEWGPCH